MKIAITNKRGFIQVPVLITIVVALGIGGGLTFLSVTKFQKSKLQNLELQTKVSELEDKEEIQKEQIVSEKEISKITTSNTPVVKQLVETIKKIEEEKPLLYKTPSGLLIDDKGNIYNAEILDKLENFKKQNEILEEKTKELEKKIARNINPPSPSSQLPSPPTSIPPPSPQPPPPSQNPPLVFTSDPKTILERYGHNIRTVEYTTNRQSTIVWSWPGEQYNRLCEPKHGKLIPGTSYNCNIKVKEAMLNNKDVCFDSFGQIFCDKLRQV